MPRVRFQRAVAGASFAARGGQVLDLPPMVAVGACRAGHAEPVDMDLDELLSLAAQADGGADDELEDTAGHGDADQDDRDGDADQDDRDTEGDGAGEPDGEGSDGDDAADEDEPVDEEPEDLERGDSAGDEPAAGPSTVASWGEPAEPEAKPAKKAPAKRAPRKRPR